VIISDINESYSKIEFDVENEKEAIELRIKLMDDLSVFVDGYKYSPKFRAGVWDGKKYYFKMLPNFGMRIPKGLVETILRRYKNNITVPYEPIRKTELVSREYIEEFVDSLGLPFSPYDYQIDALEIVVNQPRKILQSATGSGKSLIIYMIMRYFEKHDKKGLLIVPNVGLAEQMRTDFLSYGMDEVELDEKLHTIFSGKEKTFKFPMTVTTWQSAILMRRDHFSQLDYVLVDEAHLATGDSLQKLLEHSDNCLWKVGLTGTLPKTYEGRYTLAATLGKTVKIITPQGLIERGLATPVTIVTVYLNYSEEDKRAVRQLKNFQKETKFLEEHYGRNDIIARLAIQATKKYGNSLVMYSSIKHGTYLLELILKNKFGIERPFILEKVTPKRVEKMKIEEEHNDLKDVFVLTPLTEKDKKTLRKHYREELIDNIRCLDDYHIYIIKGSIEGEVRNEIRTLLENVDDAILIGSAATVSTGMNIKRLHNIFLASSTKSSIRLNQTIGRGMRLHSEKGMMRFFDFIDDFSHKTKKGKVVSKNYTLKHSYERLNGYIEHGYPIKELEIEVKGKNEQS
jgi:superfamily II DNA or RNA helicase